MTFLAAYPLGDGFALTQATARLLLITVFVRTRSLLSGVVLHTILDTFSNLIRF